VIARRVYSTFSDLSLSRWFAIADSTLGRGVVRRRRAIRHLKTLITPLGFRPLIGTQFGTQFVRAESSSRIHSSRAGRFQLRS